MLELIIISSILDILSSNHELLLYVLMRFIFLLVNIRKNIEVFM